MAVTNNGSSTLYTDSASTDQPTFNHTVPSGTDLLIMISGVRANTEMSATSPTWNGTQLSLIADTGEFTSGDARVFCHGLISPTAGSNKSTWLNWETPGSPPCSWVAMLNYSGVDTTSLAAATNSLETVANTVGDETQTVFSSAGSSGNGLLIGCGAIGANTSPASNNASFTELYDTDTGGGANNNNDQGIYVAEHLSAAPTAVAVTWGSPDENAGVYIELVAASVASKMPLFTHHLKQMQGH